MAMTAPSISDMTQLAVPTEATVFGCSLLAHPQELALAKLAVTELRQHHPDSTPSNVKAIYMSPWKSHLLTDQLTPLIKLVADKIKQASKQHLGTDLEALNYELAVADCWCAIYDTSNYTVPHTHIPSSYSAVVYLEMDDSSAPIVFNNTIAVNPVSGTLVFFPGHLLHHVPATQGKRIIVAINYLTLPVFLASAMR
jgi:hypothetical protein